MAWLFVVVFVACAVGGARLYLWDRAERRRRQLEDEWVRIVNRTAQ